MEPILLGLAVAPGVAISLFVYFRDKYEKEPFSLLLRSFVAGFFVVIPAAIIEMMLMGVFIVDPNNITHVAINNFVFIGFVEEFCKYICLMQIAFPKSDFNEPFDGIVYAVLVSMGFATAENILYVYNGGLHVALIRIFTAVPAHATFAILMGYFVGLSKFKKNQSTFLLLGLLTATIFHGAYDFFLSINNIELIALGAFVSLIVGIYLSFKAMRILNEHSPFRYSMIILGQKPIEPQ